MSSRCITTCNLRKIALELDGPIISLSDVMRRIVVFGNSGSGKTTLARALTSQYGLAHLDLDSLA